MPEPNNINKDDPNGIILDLLQRVSKMEADLEWIKKNMATKEDIRMVQRIISILKWSIGISFTIFLSLMALIGLLH